MRGTNHESGLLLFVVTMKMHLSPLSWCSRFIDYPLQCPALPAGHFSMRWGPPPGMPTYTCLSNHVMSALFPVPALDGIDLATLPLGEWPTSHLQVLASADVGRLLAAEAHASGVRVGVSTLKGGGRGVFACRSFKTGDRLMPFTGQIVYKNMDAEASSSDPEEQSSRYGTRKFSTTARHWAKTAVEVNVHGSDWSGAARTQCRTKSSRSRDAKRCRKRCACHRSVWVVPAPFCVAGVVNDYRRVPTVNGTQESGDTHRRPNAVLVQRIDPVPTHCELTQAGCIHVQVTRNIEEGEEVLLDYGTFYAYYGV